MESAVNCDAVALGRYLPAIAGVRGFGRLGREANYRDKSDRKHRNNSLFHQARVTLRSNDLRFLAKYPHQSLQFCDEQTPAKLVSSQLFVNGYQVKAALAQSNSLPWLMPVRLGPMRSLERQQSRDRLRHS